jgi:hypothetical protein
LALTFHSGGNATKLLQPIDQALGEIALATDLFVERAITIFITFAWD